MMKRIFFALFGYLTIALIMTACKPDPSYPSPLADVTIQDQTLEASETERSIEVSSRLEDVAANVIDLSTNMTATWLRVEVSKTTIKLKLDENITINDRKAEVELYYDGARDDLEGATSTVFYVEQKRNKIFDNFGVQEVRMTHLKADTIINAYVSLKNAKAVITDMEGEALNWCQVKLSGSDIKVSVNENKNNSVRQAVVRLMSSSQQSDVADSLIAQTLFLITQLKNPVLDTLKIEDQTMSYQDSKKVLKFNRKLTGVKTIVTDDETQQKSNWSTASVAGDSITLHVNMLNSKKDRQATITLYLPNNGETIDSTTINLSFKLKQLHNSATDSLVIPNDSVAYNAKSDTINVVESLAGFKAALLDLTTNMTPTWVKVKVTDHQIIFYDIKTNDNLTNRNAKVTIYQPNGNTVDENTIQHSFILTQECKKQLTPEQSNIETGYSSHTVRVQITSNVKYEIEKDSSAWILQTSMTPIDDMHEELAIDIDENKTTEDRTGTVTLRSGELTATITLKQKTNPAITLQDGNTEFIVFYKEKSEFILNVKTLTPNYTIKKTGNWLSIGTKQQISESEFSHKISVSQYTGDGPWRNDTIIVKNFLEEKRFVVKQHNLVIMEQTKVEVEEGKQIKLKCKNMSDVSALNWSSKNVQVATVDNSGMVTGVKSGTTSIKASIGSYLNVDDYNDQCVVTVYNAADKVQLQRGSGNYVKEGDYVTANCPVVITNNYDGAVTINSVTMKDGWNNIIKESIDSEVTINRDDKATFSFSSVTRIYKPVVVVKMTCNGREFEKKINY